MRKMLIALAGGALVVALASPAGASMAQPQHGGVGPIPAAHGGGGGSHFGGGWGGDHGRWGGDHGRWGGDHGGRGGDRWGRGDHGYPGRGDHGYPGRGDGGHRGGYPDCSPYYDYGCGR